MAKSYIKTNRRKLDAFIRMGGQINDLGLIVGQLTGKPKYPRGHVGSRSRDRSRKGQHSLDIKPEERQRRLQMRAAKRYLSTLPKEERKSELKRLRRQLKGLGLSTRGLGRKKAGPTAVAKVAGVLASRDQYHLKALKEGQVIITASLDTMRDTLLGHGAGNLAASLVSMGKGLKERIRSRFRATGHVDTGKLVRNIQYQIYSVGGKAAVEKAAKEARALLRANKKRRRK
jgi:uncharacterized protein (DUF2267 family)